MTLLTPQEAAERLRLSERTLRDLKRTGAIRYVAISPGRIAYRADDLAEYITTRVQCDQAPEPKPRTKRRVSVRAGTAHNIVPFSQRRRVP